MENKRIHIILATVVVATLLWISVKLGFQYQTLVKAAVVVENIPTGMALKTAVPRALQLRFRGDGWQLVPLFLGRDLRYTLDVQSLAPGKRAITLRDLAERMQIPMGAQAVDMTPESLFVELESYEEKKVPVLVDDQSAFRDGYGQIGAPLVFPESVVVGGAKSIIASIDSWRTARRRFDNVKSSIDEYVPLADTSAYRLSFSPSTVRILIEVQQFAEKTLSGLPVEVLGVPENLEVILSPPKLDIVVRSGINRLAALSVRDFRATATYDEIIGDSTGMIDTRIGFPSGVQLVSKRPDRLQYIVRKRL